MRRTFTLPLIIVVVIGLVGAYIALPWEEKPGFRPGEPFENFRIALGIDLKGGAELHYRILFPQGVEAERRAEAVRTTIEVLRRRIDEKGLVDPDMRPLGQDLISIQLPGVDQARLSDYETLMHTVGKVTWHLGAPAEMHRRAERGEPLEPGWIEKPVDDQTVRCEAHTFRRGGQRYILIEREAKVEGDNVESARPLHDPGEGWTVSFRLDTQGTQAFRRMTEQATGGEERPHNRHIAILKDVQVVSAPEVRSVIVGEGIITGSRSREDATNLAIVLNSGSLPYPIGRLDEQGHPRQGEAEGRMLVGASLGADSIRRGILALAIAGSAVALFMVVYYLGLGFNAVISLVYNLIFIVATLAIVGATLTLPGLAALILTLGMAVDANILIFERMREELVKGKTALQAFELGHERALPAILDANITTFIVGFILYYVGRGTPVAGFGVMLMIGIATTLLSVLWVGKTILRAQITSGIITQARMLRLLRSPRIPWTRYMGAAGVLSILLVAGAASALVWASGEDPVKVLLLPWRDDFSPVQNLLWAANRLVLVASVLALLLARGAIRIAASWAAIVTACLTAIPVSGAVWRNDSELWGVDFRAGTALYFRLREPAPIDEVRRRLLEFAPEYAEGRVQPVSDPDEAAPPTPGHDRAFQFRTSSTDLTKVQHDVTAALGERIWPPPFEPLPDELLTNEPAQLNLPDDPYQGRAGCIEEGPDHQGHRLVSGVVVNLRVDTTGEQDPQEIFLRAAQAAASIRSDAENRPAVLVQELRDAPPGVRRFALLFAKADIEQHGEAPHRQLVDRLRQMHQQWRDRVEGAIAVSLTEDPFFAVHQLGAVEARRLRDNSLFGLLVASVLIGLYVALRFFRSLRFGVAAVVPLFHDGLLAVAALALAQRLVPADLGLNFDINLPAVAAILTIIGYSVNDTIVIFDRIRENLIVKKREAFSEVINESVNQTLARTMVTTGTTLMAALVLYGATMTSGSGIANFAFPVSIGIVIGTYSSVFVGSWLLKALYRGGRPELGG